MKSITQITRLLSLMLYLIFMASCQPEDDTVTDDIEIPTWLQDRIDNHEATIANN